MAINERATIDLSVNAKEAQNELRKLQGSAEGLRRRIDEALQAGDSKGAEKLRKSLNQVERDMKKAERAAFDFDNVVKNLSGASVNDINRAIKTMTRQMNALPRTSKEWGELNTKIRLCRKELANLNAEGKKTQGWLGRANDTFNRWGAAVAAAAAAVTGITLSISKMRDMAKEKEDAQAQLQALTGLDDNSIAWLTQQAEQLSTSMTDGGLRIRQSATEILKAYQLVGGAKPELLENKEALNAVTIETMRLATASGMELTEAVNGVTLAMNQYGATAEEVSRYTNTLAAGAKFGSAEVDSVTAAVRRAGVAASTAGIPIEALVGAIEMLAERGIKDEVAGTGLRSFFVKLEAMAENVRPSVVGLQAALDNLRAMDLEATEVQKMFGLETYTVAQAMIDGAEKVDYYTKAVTGTAAAVEQAAVNSDTAAAKAAQAGNKMREMGAELGTRLTPLITAGAKAATVMMQALIGLIDLLERNRKIIIPLTATLTAYAAVIAVVTARQKLMEFWTKRVTTALSGMGKALKANLWAGAVGIVAGIATAFHNWYSNVRAARQETERLINIERQARAEAEENSAEQRRSLKSLYDMARNSMMPYTQRAEALAQLIKLSDRYLGSLTMETIGTQEAAQAVKDYNDYLLATAGKAAAIEARQTELQKLQEAIDTAWEGYVHKTGAPKLSAEQLIAEGAKGSDIFATYTDGTGLERRVDAVNRLTAALDGYDRTITRLNAKYPTRNTTAGGTDIPAIPAPAASGTAASSTATTEEQYYRQQEQVIDDYLKSRQTAERLAYLRREHDLEEHNRRMMQLELDAIRSKQSLYEAGGTVTDPDRWNALEVDAIPIQQSLDAQRLEGFAATLDDTAAADAVQRNIELNRLAFDALERMYDNDLVTYRQYLAMKAEIEAGNLDAAMGIRQEKAEEQRKWEDMDTEERVSKVAQAASKAWEAISPIFQASSQLVQANLAAEEAKINERYDAEIKAAEGNDARIKQLEEQRDAELAKARTEANKKAMAIQIAQAMATTAVGIINAWASAMQMPPLIAPIYGAAMTALMTAQAAIQIAAIKKQQQAQAAGYLSGGYTAAAPDDRREVGVVHANEFVANAAAVRNPAVRPMLDLIDHAQRRGIVARITPSDIAAAAGARLAYAPAAAAAVPAPATAAGGDALTGKMLDTLRRIDRRMERPLTAYTYVTGKGGSQQAQRLNDRMEANARRQSRE